MGRKEIFFITKISIISIIILPLLFICTACGNDTKKNNKTNNNEKIKEEANPLTIDAAYIVNLISIPEEEGITAEEYLKKHPEESLDNRKSNDMSYIFVFATLKSLEEGQKDLKIPIVEEYPDFHTFRLRTNLIIDGNEYKNIIERTNIYNNYIGNYKTGKNIDTNYILYSGERESVSIVSLFQIKHHDYVTAKENSSDIYFDWGDMYKSSIYAKDIIVKNNIVDVSKDLKEKGFIK